jgi:hypothetical protein
VAHPDAIEADGLLFTALFLRLNRFEVVGPYSRGLSGARTGGPDEAKVGRNSVFHRRLRVGDRENFWVRACDLISPRSITSHELQYCHMIFVMTLGKEAEMSNDPHVNSNEIPAFCFVDHRQPWGRIFHNYFIITL